MNHDKLKTYVVIGAFLLLAAIVAFVILQQKREEPVEVPSTKEVLERMSPPEVPGGVIVPNISPEAFEKFQAPSLLPSQGAAGGGGPSAPSISPDVLEKFSAPSVPGL